MTLNAWMCAALVTCGAVAHAAETWPVKPVRIVAPFAPGGYVDFTARLVAGPLAASLGQQFVVDNRAGAGGIVGTELVARAPADGYTLVIGSAGTHAVNQSLYKKLPYDVLRDFQPVVRLTDAPSLLAVHPSLPVRNVKELIVLAKQRPEQLAYASAGAGTSTHLAAVLFEHLGKVKFVHVPYKGGGPAMVAVLSGETPLTFPPPRRYRRIRNRGACAVLPSPAPNGRPCSRTCRPSRRAACPVTRCSTGSVSSHPPARRRRSSIALKPSVCVSCRCTMSSPASTVRAPSRHRSPPRRTRRS